MPSPFLTDIDSRAAVKGSRDPLGLQTIWIRLGRRVIGNLTTGSSSLRDFATLLLGYYFAERASEKGLGDGDLSVFLRWEQLAAYARREINGERGFRGFDRVSSRLQEGVFIHLGVDSDCQILSSQRDYGLWGLNTGPARASGLVAGEPTRLTAAARGLLEKHCLPRLVRDNGASLDSILTKVTQERPGIDPRGKDRGLLVDIARALGGRIGPAERDTYWYHLVQGGPSDSTAGGQALLASALESTIDDNNWSLTPARVRHLAKLCRADNGAGLVVADRLEEIRTVEMLLAPAAELFELLMRSEKQTIAEIARVVHRQWGERVTSIDPEGIGHNKADLVDRDANGQTGERWLKIALTLVSGDYEGALLLLIDQNRYIMEMRSGTAPWLDIDNGSIRVRFLDYGHADLPHRGWLSQAWRHPYFLDSLRAIVLDLRPRSG